MDDEPVLDRDRLDAIAGGSESVMREIVNSLIDEASRITAEIRVAAAESNGDRIADLVHALTGIAGNAGAVRLQRAAEELGRAGARDAPTLWNCVARLEQELAAVRALG